jgi:hypothetical protein
MSIVMIWLARLPFIPPLPPLPLEGQRTALPQRVRVGVLPSASRHPILNAYAERAVNQWKYEPGLFQGEPVSIITTVLVNFE